MIGRVIFSSGGNFRVQVNSEVYTAKPLGIFRKNNIKILVGDIVDLKVNDGNELNVITKLYDRKNEFQRPNISNVDFAIITTSINEPELNDYYLDKLIVIFQIKSVEPIILFTKSDLGVTDLHQNIINDYINAGYKVLITNNSVTEEQKTQLNKWIKGKLSVITGQTGVGKSTFINIVSGLNLKTNEISKSLGRGKHTTRHSEVFEIFPQSYVIDTPGFSSLDIDSNDIKLLPHNYYNFEKFVGKCKFNDCKHIEEDGCAVKGNVSKRIMNNYRKLLLEEKK